MEDVCDCCDTEAPPEVLAKHVVVARDPYGHTFNMFLCATCRAKWAWDWHQAPSPEEIYAAFHPKTEATDDQAIPFDEGAWKASLRQSARDVGVEMNDAEFDAFAQLALEHW